MPFIVYTSGRFNVFNPVQLAKAAVPIDVTEGNDNVSILEQFSKARYPVIVVKAGKFILESLVQSEKASYPRI